ncbi:MAG: tetratricopeptide repeat protein [Crocosphaera sp.]|nr:tetratricopeptide repeat protein [Crocosphaera sp.]
MKKITLCLKIVFTILFLSLITVKDTLAEPTVLEILTGRATWTPSAVSLVQRGKAHIEQDNFREAIADFNRAISLNPNLAEAYYYRARAQRQLESSSEFREAYVKALTVRGIARLQLGDHRRAIADLNYVIAHDPDSSLAYLNRGIARLSLGQTQLARADFRQARTFDPLINVADYQQETIALSK